MRTILSSKKSLYLFIAFIFGLFSSFSIYSFSKYTFAETENSLEEETYSFVPEEKFITIFDGELKHTVKSSALTVNEVLERLNIPISTTDSVSPSLDTKIDADNFFINIYRSRPVLIIDGIISKTTNVSSYDPKTAVRSAGFTVYDEDSIESIASSSNFLETGFSSIYKIIRGTGKTITTEEDLPFDTKTIKSYDIPTGAEEVQSLGELGKIRRVFRVKSIDGEEVEKELISEDILREPIDRVIAIGAPKISQNPLSPSMGRNHYTTTNLSGATVERQETFYDLPMSVVMGFCGKSSYTVREDGAKVDEDGYVLVAAELSRYPRCSVVETSLGPGKVYDTGGFAATNPEQFDLATDWTNHDGR